MHCFMNHEILYKLVYLQAIFKNNPPVCKIKGCSILLLSTTDILTLYRQCSSLASFRSYPIFRVCAKQLYINYSRPLNTDGKRG